jgi:hypothetical protein
MQSSGHSTQPMPSLYSGASASLHISNTAVAISKLRNSIKELIEDLWMVDYEIALQLTIQY